MFVDIYFEKTYSEISYTTVIKVSELLKLASAQGNYINVCANTALHKAAAGPHDQRKWLTAESNIHTCMYVRATWVTTSQGQEDIQAKLDITALRHQILIIYQFTYLSIDQFWALYG